MTGQCQYEHGQFSLITRTYRGRHDLLVRAGEFVRKQTYKKVEWIIVEDGSSDEQSSVKSCLPAVI